MMVSPDNKTVTHRLVTYKQSHTDYEPTDGYTQTSKLQMVTHRLGTYRW